MYIHRYISRYKQVAVRTLFYENSKGGDGEGVVCDREAICQDVACCGKQMNAVTGELNPEEGELRVLDLTRRLHLKGVHF